MPASTDTITVTFGGREVVRQINEVLGTDR